jgi:hypothetical protein
MEPGIAIPILPARDLGETREFYECYWRVTNPDQLHAEASQAGLEKWPNARVEPVQNKPWGTREFALVDPNGNLVRIGVPTRG